MNVGARCSLNRGYAFVASLVLAAFALSIAAAGSPQLHTRIHPDANSSQHTCAATLIASGNYEHHAPPPLVGSFTAPGQFIFVELLTAQSVDSIFLGASIFEHAPPTNA
jgi:hypothetical protein